MSILAFSTTAIILSTYTGLIASFIYGLCKKNDEITDEIYKKIDNKNLSISLIVVCKNEAENIENLIESIENSGDYKDSKKKSFDKIVLVNDHSTDETLNLMKKLEKKFSNVIIHNSINFGKKNAIKEALKYIDTDYIAFTDGDCILSQNYYSRLHNYISKNSCDMLIGGVKLSGDGLFAACQQMEYASLQASTAGAAMNNSPIMCNGANLTVRTSLYKEHFNDINYNEISGDDMFMLHSFKRNRYKINYLLDKNFVVTTKACSTLKEFIQQRTRWSSKTASYRDFFTLVTASSVASMNLLIIALIIETNILLSIAFLTKLIVDSILIATYYRKLKLKFELKNLLVLLLVAIIYPFYCCLIVVLSLFKRYLNSKSW